MAVKHNTTTIKRIFKSANYMDEKWEVLYYRAYYFFPSHLVQYNDATLASPQSTIPNTRAITMIN